MNLSKNSIVSVAGPIFGVVAIYFGCRTLNTFWTLKEAENEIHLGRGALASELLEPYRDRMTANERRCTAYLRSNFMSHRPERIQWGAESCLGHGIDLPEIAIALAAAKEAAGEAQEAVNLLVESAPKYKGSAIVYMKLASMMKAAKNEQGTRFAMLKAVDQAPEDVKILWTALQFFAAESKWDDAKQMAARIKDLPGANLPEVKFLAARALSRGGDAAASLAVSEQGKSLIATKPEMQERFNKEYPEFFAPTAGQMPQSLGAMPPAQTSPQDQASPQNQIRASTQMRAPTQMVPPGNNIKGAMFPNPPKSAFAFPGK